MYAGKYRRRKRKIDVSFLFMSIVRTLVIGESSAWTAYERRWKRQRVLLALTFPPRSRGGLMSSTLRWEEASEHPQKSGWEPERKRVDWLVRLGYSRHIGNAEKETLLV